MAALDCAGPLGIEGFERADELVIVIALQRLLELRKPGQSDLGEDVPWNERRLRWQTTPNLLARTRDGVLVHARLSSTTAARRQLTHAGEPDPVDDARKCLLRWDVCDSTDQDWQIPGTSTRA